MSESSESSRSGPLSLQEVAESPGLFDRGCELSDHEWLIPSRLKGLDWLGK